MANIKHAVTKEPQTKNKFDFSPSFKRMFDGMITAYGDSLKELNKAKSALKAEYGVCACDYNLRYITPKNVSSFVSNLVKGIDSGMFHGKIGDVEMFTVASVKRFLEENECVPFEDARIINHDHSYVNPKDQTLQDLAFIAKNDIGEVAVYSHGEMVKRYELASEDIGKINNMHFAANMKNIVKQFPSVLEKGCEGACCWSAGYRDIFRTYLEEFILFACTLNTMAVLQLLAYVSPSVDYTIKKKNENSEDLITECCLCKTNDYMIRNKIPFNCNMRDVILQDVTPDFKDTHDALHFIMLDARSPISILVNKYASKEADVHSDCGLIARMFLGNKHCHWGDDLYKHENGERLIGGQNPYETAGFNTKVDWLDTIAFGNNYLDGNYRRDAMGNNHSHPILNTLDMVYKIFGGVELKSNEDIANNIVRVANAIRSIINEYREDKPIENYDITKDVLVLLGEIMTRNMLRLYYNNTLVYAITDDMPDAGAPGFVLEEFVMEADGGATADANKQGGNTAVQGNANAPKTTVSFKDSKGQDVAKNLGTKIKDVFQKFIQWVRNTMSKFFENFNKNHQKELEWINKNDALNKEIGEAIAAGKFNPVVNNWPEYKVPEQAMTQIKIADNVKKKIEEIKQNKNEEYSTVSIIGLPDNITTEIEKAIAGAGADENKKNAQINEMLSNYMLYGQTAKPQTTQSKQMNQTMWNDLVGNLKESPKAIEEVNKANVENLTAAGDAITQAYNQLSSTQNQDEANTKRAEIDRLSQAVQTANSIWTSKTLNTLAKDFYSQNYTLYRSIINGYQQQKNSGALNQSKTNNGEQGNNVDENGNPVLNTGGENTEQGGQG